MSLLRHLLLIAGVAIGFPLTLVSIGAAHCYANEESLSVATLGECLYFLTGVATVFMCVGVTLLLLNRLFTLEPVDLPDDDSLTFVPCPGRQISLPKPYRIRLARFLGIPPSDLDSTRCGARSNMTFWTSATTFIRRGPKPPALIRFFLEQIRRVVQRTRITRAIPLGLGRRVTAVVHAEHGNHRTEQIGETELARLSVFRCRFLRLQFLVYQHQLRWPANPATSAVTTCRLHRSGQIRCQLQRFTPVLDERRDYPTISCQLDLQEGQSHDEELMRGTETIFGGPHVRCNAN